MMQEHHAEQPFPWWRLGVDTGEGIAVVVFQTTLIHLVPLGPLRPDCIFLFLAYKAITRPRIPCLLLAFITSLFQDSLVGRPYFGAHIVSGLVIVGLVGLFRNSIPRERKFLPFLLVVLTGSLFHNLFYGGIIWWKGGEVLSHVAVIAGTAALATTVVSSLVLGIITLTQSSLHGR